MEIRLKKDYWGRTKIKEIIYHLRNMPQIDEIQYGQKWIETFTMVVYVIRFTQWIVGGVLIVAILFIVSNTLQLTMSTRRDEIEVMHLLGATPGFIKIPFYIEGMIQGFLGGVIALFLLFIMYKVIQTTIEPIIKGWMTGIKILFLPWDLTAWFLSGGIIIGLIGSFVASIRFLRNPKVREL